uniref:Uncharacterized protein n=1 Tax=Arion vulgaris TaxID=1028688 RepID=A0A0B7A2B9_9EUPU
MQPLIEQKGFREVSNFGKTEETSQKTCNYNTTNVTNTQTDKTEERLTLHVRISWQHFDCEYDEREGTYRL